MPPKRQRIEEAKRDELVENRQALEASAANHVALHNERIRAKLEDMRHRTTPEEFCQLEIMMEAELQIAEVSVYSLIPPVRASPAKVKFKADSDQFPSDDL